MCRLELDRVVVHFGREGIWSLAEVGSTFVLVGEVGVRNCRLVVVRKLLGPEHGLLELVLVPGLGRGLVLELGVGAVAAQVELGLVAHAAC